MDINSQHAQLVTDLIHCASGTERARELRVMIGRLERVQPALEFERTSIWSALGGSMPTNIATYIWEIGAGGRTAIIGHNGEWHVLVACDTFAHLPDAARRRAEIEQHFEAGQCDEPQWIVDLLDAVRLAQPFVNVHAPSPIADRLEAALRNRHIP